MDILLGKKVKSKFTPTVEPTATVEVKSKKDDEVEIPTHLCLRWLNNGGSKLILKDEWNTFVPVLQKRFLLLRWRRNVTSSFWRWFRRGSSSSSKGMTSRRILIT